MIPQLGIPEYYVQSVEIDADPIIGEPVMGSVFSSFNVTDPELRTDPSGLSCRATLELELFPADEALVDTIDDINQENDSQRFGSVEVTCLIFVPGEQSDLERYHSTWLEQEYEYLDSEFIAHLESGLLREILNPIGRLLSDSFEGIVPWMQLTPMEAQTANREGNGSL
jgi:hypothetical protein